MDRVSRYENAVARERLRGQARVERRFKQRREPPAPGRVDPLLGFFGQVSSREFRLQALEARARALALAGGDFATRVALEDKLARMRARSTPLQTWWQLSEEAGELLGEG